MPLTPADIHNVAFKKPPIGKRGYDEEEVDAFLDEVERELGRLIEENATLRVRAERGGAGDTRPGAELEQLKARLETLQRERAAAEDAAHAARARLDQARGQAPQEGLAPHNDDPKAVRVLMMAQRTADEHVSDARKEAQAMITEARLKADSIGREAQAKATSIEMQAVDRHRAAMAGLDAKRDEAQQHIRQMMRFERDYRSRLSEHLSSLLGDLGFGGSPDNTRNRMNANLGVQG